MELFFNQTSRTTISKVETASSRCSHVPCLKDLESLFLCENPRKYENQQTLLAME